ncbi:hypothetical protein TorRG33x02_255610 [Trema orientale]|uniref:Uncharacterized protein n=1 Tax=Trema orientale TaxID=63057 RepID=A0A2P5DCN7_TREOI|nr:hypothetical protein TorRG33x02_255610 [Trema orientale]
MSEIRTMQTQEHTQASTTSDSDGNLVQSASPCIDERAIADHVFGVHRGHMKGIGRLLKGYKAFSSTTSQFAPQQSQPAEDEHVHTDQLRHTKTQLRKTQTQLRDTQLQFQELRTISGCSWYYSSSRSSK